ncbi:MAG TPA: ROK family transcriptional regulator [Clostridiales bacterium]|nr:ROK family transcriptional regulator [Clostridiales bacterium]
MSNQNTNRIEIKKINRNRIYKLIYQKGEMSKQSIAYALNISLPTVTQNLRILLEQDLILESGMFESTGGRKAKAVSYNPGARYSVGVDITKNHVVVVVVDLGARVIQKLRVRLVFENKREYFQKVGALIEQTIRDSQVDERKILGVGISIPGLLSQDARKVVYATILGFTGGRIESFEEFIPYPCIFSNDASAAGFAEVWNTNMADNMVYLSLSDSVGGAIFLNQNFYPGDNQRSAEFGHMTIVPNGRECYCGMKGCVDAYCNSRILSESAPNGLDGFFELLRQGSPTHQKIWEEYLEYLLITINNLRMLFDCRVVLGGYVGNYMEEHIHTLREMASKRNTFECDGTYLQVCRYKTEASAVGAALQHVQPFIDSI